MPITAGDVLFQIGSNISQVESDLVKLKQQFVSVGGSASSAFATASKPVDAVGQSLNKASQSAVNLGSNLASAGKQGGAAFTSADSAVKGFGSSLGSLKSIAQGLGLTFGALGIAQAIKAGTEAALDFQKAWTKVSVILRDDPGGAKVLDEFKEKIMALPPALGTAAENASAFYQIISSGFTEPAQALELLKNSAIAAAGGFTTTEVAARSGAAILKAYGLEVGRSREVFDMMAKTVDLGVISFEELASELGNVIPIAAANNISFQELSGGIAALTLRGLPASQAITGLRSTIASIISPSEKAAEVAEKLGIRWDAQILKAKGLEGVLAQLAGNTKVTAEDISLLTGRIEATNSVMALTAKGGLKEFREAVEKVAHASDGAGASAESLAAAQKTLTFELRAAKNEIINSAAAVGDKLAPALASAVRGIRDFSGAFVSAGSAAVEFWSQAFSGADGAIDALTAVDDLFGGAGTWVGKITGLGPAFSAVSDAVDATGKKVDGLGTSIGKMTGLGPAFDAVSEAVSFTASSATAAAVAFGAFGIAMAGLKLSAMITSIGGLSGALALMSGSITASVASAGVLGIALAAIPYAIIAGAIAGIAAAWYAMSTAQEEMVQNTRQADALLNRLAADTLRKLQQAGDEQGVATIKRLSAEFNSGKISANEFQIAIGKLTNDLAKLKPGEYFKDSILKSISAEVDKLGLKSTGSLEKQAQEASAVVASIQAKLKNFTGTVDENKKAQVNLGLALAEQNKRWNEYKTAMAPVAKGTKDQAEASKKAETAAHQLSEKLKTLSKTYGGVEGAALASIKTLKEDILFLAKNKASTDVLAGAKNKLGQETLKLIAAQSKQPAILKQIDTITADVNGTFQEFNATAGLSSKQFELLRKNSGMTAEQFRQLADFTAGPLDLALRRNISTIDTGVAALYRLGLAAKAPKDAFAETENAMKSLGVTSDAELRGIAQSAQENYEKVSQRAGASIREIELSWAAMAEKQIEVAQKTGQEIPRATAEAVEKIKGKYGELKKTSDYTFTSAAEVAKKQISTIFTDFSKGFADILFSAGTFGKKMTDLFKEIGKSLVRGFLESGLLGLFNNQGLKGFSGFIDGITKSLGKLFGQKSSGGGDLSNLISLFSGGAIGGGGGAATGALGAVSQASTFASLFGGGGTSLGGVGGLITAAKSAGLLSALGIGGASAGLIGGAGAVAGGSLASIASAGIVPGFLLSGGTVAGTAGAAGIGSGLAAGTAGSATLASTLGALASNPITIAAAAAIAGIVLTRRLTRRGREKEEATGSAESLSTDVWKGIVPEVQAGRLTIDEGIAAIQQRFADYEEWLRANLKDQTVITRSIESQRITVTESIATLEKMRAAEAETAVAREEIEKYIAEAARTGAFAQGFTDLLEEAGAKVEDFDEALKLGSIFKAQEGLTGLHESLFQMSEAAKDVFAEFAQGGPITDGLRLKMLELSQATGVNTDALLQSMAAYASANANLSQFEGGLGTISELMEKLKDNPFEIFVESGQILPELRDEIYKFGLDLSTFEEFSQVNEIKDAFGSLVGAFTGTADQIAALSPMFQQMGGDMAALNAAAALPGLREAQGLIKLFQEELNTLLPAQEQTGLSAKEMLDQFFKTGQVVPQLASQIQAAGGDLTKFNQLGTSTAVLENFQKLSDEFDKTGVKSKELSSFLNTYASASANASLQAGASIGDVLKMVDTQLKNSQSDSAKVVASELKLMNGNVQESIKQLETNLNKAIDAVGDKISDNYERARLGVIAEIGTMRTQLTGSVDLTRDALIATLGTLDTNIQSVINKMTNELGAAVSKLASDLGNVRTAAAPTPTPSAPPAPTPAPSPTPQDTYNYPYPDYSNYSYGGGFSGLYPGGMDAFGYPVVGAFQRGGLVPRSGLARVDRGELVLPEKETRDLTKLFDSLEGAGLSSRVSESLAKLSQQTSAASGGSVGSLASLMRAVPFSSGPSVGASASAALSIAEIEKIIASLSENLKNAVKEVGESNQQSMIEAVGSMSAQLAESVKPEQPLGTDAEGMGGIGEAIASLSGSLETAIVAGQGSLDSIAGAIAAAAAKPVEVFVPPPEPIESGAIENQDIFDSLTSALSTQVEKASDSLQGIFEAASARAETLTEDQFRAMALLTRAAEGGVNLQEATAQVAESQTEIASQSVAIQGIFGSMAETAEQLQTAADREAEALRMRISTAAEASLEASEATRDLEAAKRGLATELSEPVAEGFSEAQDAIEGISQAVASLGRALETTVLGAGEGVKRVAVDAVSSMTAKLQESARLSLEKLSRETTEEPGKEETLASFYKDAAAAAEVNLKAEQFRAKELSALFREAVASGTEAKDAVKAFVESVHEHMATAGSASLGGSLSVASLAAASQDAMSDREAIERELADRSVPVAEGFTEATEAVTNLGVSVKDYMQTAGASLGSLTVQSVDGLKSGVEASVGLLSGQLSGAVATFGQSLGETLSAVEAVGTMTVSLNEAARLSLIREKEAILEASRTNDASLLETAKNLADEISLPVAGGFTEAMDAVEGLGTSMQGYMQTAGSAMGSLTVAAVDGLRAGLESSVGMLGGQIGMAVTSVEERLGRSLSEVAINTEEMLGSISRRSLEILSAALTQDQQRAAEEQAAQIETKKIEINQNIRFDRVTDGREERRMMQRVNDTLVSELNVY